MKTVGGDKMSLDPRFDTKEYEEWLELLDSDPTSEMKEILPDDDIPW